MTSGNKDYVTTVVINKFWEIVFAVPFTKPINVTEKTDKIFVLKRCLSTQLACQPNRPLLNRAAVVSRLKDEGRRPLIKKAPSNEANARYSPNCYRRIKLDLVGAANASKETECKKNATIMITGGWIPSRLDGSASKLAKAKSVERLMLCLSQGLLNRGKLARILSTLFLAVDVPMQTSNRSLSCKRHTKKLMQWHALLFHICQIML